MAKSGFHLEIIPNMYDLGFFKKTMRSRRRLRLTTLGAVLGLTAAFGAGGGYIRHWGQESWIIACIIIVLYIGAIVVGYLGTLTLGDVLFAGPWREKMARGAGYIPEDVKDQKALLKNRNIHFILIWGAVIVMLVLGCDFCTGGGVRWYHRVGGVIVSMRSGDSAERAFVLQTISNPIYADRWADSDVRDHVVGLILDEDPSVRGWAAYLAGRARYVEAAENLKTALGDGEGLPVARREAAVALGRLEWKPARSLLLTVLRDVFAANRGDEEVVPAVLYAFYLMKDPMAARDALRIIRSCRDGRGCGPAVLQYAFFYLKSLHAGEAAPVCMQLLEDSGTSREMRCYAADTLRFTATKEEVAGMKRVFERVSSAETCPVVYRKYHQEAAIILFEDDPVRSLIVRAVGNRMDAADYDWIWSIGSNSAENMRTRKVAEMYTRAMRQKGIVK